jgi:hypothetical protein
MMRTREILTIAMWLSLPLLGLGVFALFGLRAGAAVETFVVGLALFARPHLGRRLANLVAGSRGASPQG